MGRIAAAACTKGCASISAGKLVSSATVSIASSSRSCGWQAWTEVPPPCHAPGVRPPCVPPACVHRVRPWRVPAACFPGCACLGAPRVQSVSGRPSIDPTNPRRARWTAPACNPHSAAHPRLAAGPHPRALLGLPGARYRAAGTGAHLPGPGVEFPVPGSGHSQRRRLPHHLRGRDAGGRGARRGRRGARVREPLRPSRRADLPGGRRLGQGFRLRLPRLALRPVRQPDIGRVPPRRERPGRHGEGLRHARHRPAQAAHHDVLRPGVRHAVGGDARRSRSISARRSPAAFAAC